jgi:hypothetical protein
MYTNVYQDNIRQKTQKSSFFWKVILKKEVRPRFGDDMAKRGCLKRSPNDLRQPRFSHIVKQKEANPW